MKTIKLAALLILISVTLFSCSKGDPGSTNNSGSNRSGNNNNNNTVAPIAGFTYSATGTASIALSFANTSFGAVSYLWDFGDGTGSTLANPIHVYSTGGTYTVVLKAVNSAGSNTATGVITISNPTSVTITSVKITSLPFINSSGNAWDIGGTGPDVYLKIFAPVTNTLLVTSSTFNDVVPANIPLSWNFGSTVVITNFYSNATIDVYDQDPVGSDFMGGYTFNLSNQVLSGYSTTAILQDPTSALTIQLTLQWQ